ncbi:MAG: pyrimidine dimer DNA glycosylase/endonuclease V [Thermoplasmata archaeon]
MRVWDVPVERLCRNHLLAEHRELHAIWNIVLKNRKGYSKHPEVMRWRGKLAALWKRHEEQRLEMLRRGYKHRSPLSLKDVPRQHRGTVQRVRVEPVEAQLTKLRLKGCGCSTRACGRRKTVIGRESAPRR